MSKFHSMAVSTCDDKVWQIRLGTVELHRHHLAVCDAAATARLQQLLVLQPGMYNAELKLSQCNLRVHAVCLTYRPRL